MSLTERCASIEAELPDGYRVDRWGRFAYAIRVDMSDGPIRRKYIGEMTPNRGGWWAVSAAVMAALAAAHSFIAVSGIMFDRHTTGGVPLSNVLAGCPDSAGEARESILAGITYAEAVNESTLCMLETLRGVAVKWMFRALMVATIARLLM